MMRGFRRAQLRGSDELFRSTRAEPEDAAEEPGHRGARAEESRIVHVNPPGQVSVVPAAPEPDSRTVRLTEEEIELLADALQKLKFPKPVARPPVHEHERFEELRQKLLSAL